MRLVSAVRTYLPSFAVYFMVGGGSALVEWASFLLAVRSFAFHYVPASVFAFVVATGVNYLLSSRVAFRSRGRSARSEAALVYLVSLVGLGVNLLVMAFLVEVFGIGLLAGKVAGTGVAFGWNFLARQFLIFSRTPRWTGLPLSRRSPPAPESHSQGTREGDADADTAPASV